jgi:hypothetical protein
MKTNLKKHRKIKEDINNKRFPVREEQSYLPLWFGLHILPTLNFKTSHFWTIYSFPSRISALFLLHTKTNDAILLTAKVAR